MIDWNTLPFDQASLENYLSSLYDTAVSVLNVRPLKEGNGNGAIKAFGYGYSLRITLSKDGNHQEVVLHTTPRDRFGHHRRSDQARDMLLDYDNFNELPRHIPALDVGAFTGDYRLLSLGWAEEFFLVTPFVDGKPYARDLQRIARQEVATARDELRVLAMADYLAEIHARKQPDGDYYKRRLRDLLGHGEGILAMTDSYPPDLEFAPAYHLVGIEQRCLRWRWEINHRAHRLSQVHGDFHPWNIRFQGDEPGDFITRGRSRGAWGEPADDLTALSINFILFSLRHYGRYQEPFRRLFSEFWRRYLEKTGDHEVLEVVQPFFVWRALMLANPAWYPDLKAAVRRYLFDFIGNLLMTKTFDPTREDGYLE